MSHERYIYVNPEDLENDDDEIAVSCHYMIGYCPQNLTDYQDMAATLRKDFPEAQDKDIGCHQITRSDRHKGFTMIAWNGKVKKSRVNLPTKEGYTEMTDNKKPYARWVQLPKFKDWYVTEAPRDYGY